MKWWEKLRKASISKKPAADLPQVSPAEQAAEPLKLTLLYPVMTDQERLRTLSPREREVFDAMLEGKKQREIADQLGVKLTTVSFHCTSMYKKLDIHDKAHLFMRYARFGNAPNHLHRERKQ